MVGNFKAVWESIKPADLQNTARGADVTLPIRDVASLVGENAGPGRAAH